MDLRNRSHCPIDGSVDRATMLARSIDGCTIDRPVRSIDHVAPSIAHNKKKKKKKAKSHSLRLSTSFSLAQLKTKVTL